jgi:TolA-binding protein
MSNRVEELESQVAQLQAAVDGLTEELVETRERLRQLEAEEGVDHSRAPERREAESASSQDGSADADATADVPTDPDGETAVGTDATADADAEVDDEDGSDSDGNDIIVA